MKNIFLSVATCLIIFSSYSRSQWIEQLLPGEVDVCYAIDFVTQNQGVIGGEHLNIAGQYLGNAFYTTDAGTSWIESTIPIEMRALLDIKLINNNVGYGVGAYNLSANFNTKNISTLKEYHHLVLEKYYESNGPIFKNRLDFRGCFIETTDGGLSWHTKGTFSDSVNYALGIHFFDLQNGLVLVSGPEALSFAILKTSDGGYSWNNVYPFEHYLRLNEIEFFDQLNGIAVGSFGQMEYSGVILKTTDGGNSWTKIELPFVAALNKGTYLNVNTMLVSGTDLVFQGVIYKSEDGGITWQEFKNYGNMASVNVVSSLPESGTVLICGVMEQSGLTMPFTDISVDGGLTWHYTQLSGFQGYASFNSEMFDYSRWYLTGTKNMTTQGFVLFTDNSGGVPVEFTSFTAGLVDGKVHLKWTTATELNNLGFEVERKSDKEEWRTIGFVEGNGTTTETQNYFFKDDLFGINSSKVFYRIKQIDFDGSFEYSEVITVELSIPYEFSLFQNYPNPFNPTTKIKFTIPNIPLSVGEGQGVRLVVYDVLVNEIATLVNEDKQAGVYEVEFNASVIDGGLPSGIYFYKLTVGEYNQTKKMIYLK